MKFREKLIAPVFKNLTPEELDYLLQTAKTSVFEKGEILIREG